VGDQHGVVQAGVGEVVAVAAGGSGDQAVGAEPPQVIAHLPGGDVVFVEQLGEQGVQVAVGESVGEQPEDQQGLEQGVGSVV